MQNVNIMTLNLHCLVEEQLAKKQQQIANYIHKQDIDIIFFQEVAQTQKEPIITDQIRSDNYILTLQRLLQKNNRMYHIYYHPFKASFNKYDEGLGFLSKYPLTLQDIKRISNVNSYEDWHTRYVITYHVTIGETTLYLANTHFGWSDETERFEDQFDRAIQTLPDNQIGIIAGDFNVEPTSIEYAHIMEHGLFDTFDNETFRRRPTHISQTSEIRIDYIMSTKPLHIIKQDVVFNEQHVSDHMGLYLQFQVK